MKKGFDNDKYVKIQSEHIKERFNLPLESSRIFLIINVVPTAFF